MQKANTFRIWILLLLIVNGSALWADATPWRKFKIVDRSLLIETEVEGFAGYSVLTPIKRYNYIDSDWLSQNLTALQQKGAARGENRKNWRTRELYADRIKGPNSYAGIRTKVLGVEAELGGLLRTDIKVPDVQMEIGSSVSDNFVFQFDFRKSLVRILTRGSINLETTSNILSRPEPRLGFPSVKVRLTSWNSYWLAIQPVERYGISVERGVAERHGWLNGETKLNPIPSSLQYSKPALEFTLSSISFGDVELENVVSATPLVGGLMSRNKNLKLRYCPHTFCKKVRSKGMVGQDVLKHFVVTIDFKESLVRVDTDI